MRYSNVCARIVLRSFNNVLARCEEVEGGEGDTESVHLNCPRNMRESEVVIRRFLLRREFR
jgi:hypothetical protein